MYLFIFIYFADDYEKMDLKEIPAENIIRPLNRN